MGTDAPSYGRILCERARRIAPLALLAATLACALGIALGLASCSGRHDRRLNVILVSIDSLRADHLDGYGYRSATGEPTSPNLDQLAKEGVLFEHAVSTTSWTRPSHHALLTGLPDLAHGAVDDAIGLSKQRVELAEVLANAGYTTAGFYSGPYLSDHYGFGKGFDTWKNVSGVDEQVDATILELVKKLQEDLTLSDETRQKLRDEGIAAAVEDGYHRAETADKVSDAAISWLDGRKGAADPFFLFVHYFDVHYDFAPPQERYAARFWPGNRRPRINGDRFFDNADIHAGMDPNDLAGVKSYYDGEILWVDEQLGRLLKRIDELGLRDDTAIVVVSDHGDEFFEHGAKGHRQNLFGSTTNVVTIFRVPGRLPEGRRVASRVSLVDVAPTIVELTGAQKEADALAPPSGNDGRDLGLVHGMWGRSVLPLLSGEERGDRDGLGFLTNRWQDMNHPVDTWALWTGSLKVVVSQRYERKLDANGNPLPMKVIERRGLVFDLATDPGELHDLAASNSPAVAAAIARFDLAFGPAGKLARLVATFEAGAPPPPLAATKAALLQKLGYTQNSQPPQKLPPGTKLKELLPPPPTFPRER
jgi:arylsulfatase A-like enzyme